MLDQVQHLVANVVRTSEQRQIDSHRRGKHVSCLTIYIQDDLELQVVPG